MFEYTSFIAKCQSVGKNVNAAEEVRYFVAEVMSDLGGIRAFLEALRPLEKPGDAILFRAPNLFVYYSFLIPGLMSPPHTHGTWVVVGLVKGQEDNVFYQRQKGSLKEVGRKSLHGGDVLLLDESTIHAVSNPLDKPSFALHVYGGDLLTVERSMWNPFTSEELPFELNQFLKYSLEMMQLHPTEMDKC